MDSLCFSPIGIIRTAWQEKSQVPFQGKEAKAIGTIELDPKFLPAVKGLKPGQNIWILGYLNQANEPSLTLHPRGDVKLPVTGLFNTRTPNRPNPISMTLVELLEIKGEKLTVLGVDLLDKTPLLDIKPYFEHLDQSKGEK